MHRLRSRNVSGQGPLVYHCVRSRFLVKYCQVKAPGHALSRVKDPGHAVCSHLPGDPTSGGRCRWDHIPHAADLPSAALPVRSLRQPPPPPPPPPAQANQPSRLLDDTGSTTLKHDNTTIRTTSIRPKGTTPQSTSGPGTGVSDLKSGRYPQISPDIKLGVCKKIGRQEWPKFPQAIAKDCWDACH